MRTAENSIIYPAELERQFDHTALRDQFILCQNESHVPDGWSCSRQGKWIVATDGLPVIDILRGGERLGWLVGHPISRTGALLRTDITLDIDTSPLGPVEQAEDTIDGLGGHFAAVIVHANSPRVFLDPSGSLATVYSPRHRIVAASPALIPYSHGCDDNLPLIRAFGVPGSGNWYPFGLTPRHGISRLLPNFNLDLESWECRRRWPLETIVPDMKLSDAADLVGEITTESIEAVVEQHHPYLSLTAGLDSRMLLSCARGVVDRIDWFTVAIGDRVGAVDCQIAAILAQRFHLQHQIFQVGTPTKLQVSEWLYRTGCCVGELRGISSLTAYQQFDWSRPQLPGMVGEVARAYFWARDDHIGTIITPENLVDRLRLSLSQDKLPPDIRDDLLHRAAQWLASLPALDALITLDLLYLEQRVGAWAGPLLYGEYPFRLYPMSHRSIVETLLKLSVEDKRSGRLQLEVIKRQWPELLKISVNRPVGMMRISRMARNSVQKSKQLTRRSIKTVLKRLVRQ